jgi:LPXTG-motif cell wall-anchored protein
MGLGKTLRAFFAGEDHSPALPSRAERRRAARERHRDGGPLWTDKDRHLDPGALPDIAETSNTWPLASGGLVIGGILGSIRRRKRRR